LDYIAKERAVILNHKTRPESALIWNLGQAKRLLQIVREWNQTSRLFAIASKPKVCPESPDSPIDPTRQRNFS